jgi:hypothetical protein
MIDKQATVITYPPVPEEPLSTAYAVAVNGRDVPIYQALLDDYRNSPLQMDDYYSFASFDCDGPVTVVIESAEPLSALSIRSHDQDIAATLDGNRATFTLAANGNFLIERNGNGRKDLLLLFANPVEVDPPTADDPAVVYFGPGYHNPGLIELSSNQTLYIHGGAVVIGRVVATGDNIQIRGRGLLGNAGEAYFRKHLILLQDCSSARVEGIVLRKQSQHWTLVAKQCDDVVVSNVKICGSFYGNDDGIDPVNSRNMLIEDCLIRTKDDCLAFKGFDDELSNCENITVTRTTMWTDQCCTILLGDECRAAFMRNITIKDCFVPYISYEGYPKKFLMLHAGEEMRMENIRFENIEIRGQGQDRNYIEMTCEYNQYSKSEAAGHIHGVLLKHVHVSGDQGGYHIVIKGHDAEHGIDGVVFEDCSVPGRALTADYPNLEVGQHVGNVRFDTMGEDTP